MIYYDRQYVFHFNNRILEDTILLASAFPRYIGLTVAFGGLTVTLTVRFDYFRF
jgi:hypothetical protein